MIICNNINNNTIYQCIIQLWLGRPIYYVFFISLRITYEEPCIKYLNCLVQVLVIKINYLIGIHF